MSTGAFDSTVSIGTVGAIPTGPRGRGIERLAFADGVLTAAMTDGTSEVVPFPLATGGGTGNPEDPALPDDPNSIPVSSAVIAFVAQQTAPLATKASVNTGLAGKANLTHTHVIADITGLSTRLDAIDTAVQGVLDEGATDAELAAAIAALSLSSYLKSADATNQFAPKNHSHAIADTTGLQAKLDAMDAAIAAASGVDMSSYALKSDLNAKYTTPTSGTTGNVLTWTGSGLALQPVPGTDLSAYYTKAQSDANFATKAHNHAMSEVTGLVAALGAKLTAPTSGTIGHVLTWTGVGGIALTAVPPPAVAQTYTFSQAGILAVKPGVHRLYNDGASARTITKLRASVDTPPTGSGVTVTLKVDGTSAGTVTIAAGAGTAVSTLGANWPAGSYLTVDVTAVGSATPGSDLTVSVAA